VRRQRRLRPEQEADDERRLDAGIGEQRGDGGDQHRHDHGDSRRGGQHQHGRVQERRADAGAELGGALQESGQLIERLAQGAGCLAGADHVHVVGGENPALGLEGL